MNMGQKHLILQNAKPADAIEASKRPFYRSFRFQLIGGLLINVLLPTYFRYQFGLTGSSFYHALSSELFTNAALGTSIALVFGYLFLRQLIAYPGVKATTYILPTFCITYGLLLLVLIFFRLDYSRFQILTSFILTVLWFYGVYLHAQSLRKPRIGMIPGGESRSLVKIDQIEWVNVNAPGDLPARYDGLVADLRADFSPEWERFLALCALKGIPVYHIKQLAESLTGRVEIEHLSENTLGSILPNVLYLKLKHLFDVLGVIVLLPVLVPIMMAASIAIKFSSPGPVFFTQPRIGFRGKLFTIYKFRTMRVAQSQGVDLKITKDGDERITPVGRFLREYRIDELPQIFNILKGEISWIGPRPEAVELSFWYETEIPYYVYRHVVRPGISGWAQVQQGHVAAVDAVKDKLHYDFYYIKNFSLMLDLLIVAKTLKTILTRFGAR